MAEENLYNACLRKAMAVCAKREYCRSDILHKLQSWQLPVKDIDSILERLVSDKFIDENRYAHAFVKDKFRYNKWGKIKISSALRLKNIPGDVINRALESIDDEAYINAVKTLIMTHRKSVTAKNQYDLKGKLLRYGLSKGFESHILYDILNDLE
jgi:regulatory protein